MKRFSFTRSAALMLIAGCSLITIPLLASSTETTSSPAVSWISCEVPGTEATSTVKSSHRLKTLTKEFWEVLESEMKKAPEALQRKGFVVGDFHFANLGLYYDYRMNQTRLMLNDLDDSGVNYLLGDLLKFLTYVRWLDKDMNLEKIVKSYQEGLAKGRPGVLPSELLELANSGSQKNKRNLERYLEKRKLEADQFDPSILTPDQEQTFAQIESLPFIKGNLKLQQKWLAKSKSGSSLGMERYLFFATNIQSQSTGLLEFKEMKCSATGAPDRQNLAASYNQFRNYLKTLSKTALDPKSPLETQQILMIKGRAFLARIKLPNLMNDLEIENSKTSRLQEYARFFAQYLGYVHSKSSDSAYQAALTTEREYILKKASTLNSTFKKSLRNGS